MNLTQKEKELILNIRKLEEVGVAQDFHLDIHYIPIVDFGSEKHKLVLGISNPVPSQRIRDAMRALMQDIKKGNHSSFLFLISYDHNFNMLKLLKIEPTANVG